MQPKKTQHAGDEQEKGNGEKDGAKDLYLFYFLSFSQSVSCRLMRHTCHPILAGSPV